MSQERKKIEVRIKEADDPESKLKAELGRLSEDESKEAVQLTVNAYHCGGVDQVDRTAKADAKAAQAGDKKAAAPVEKKK